MDIFASIAKELKVRREQVEVTVGLLDEGATVPFIARYRKEVTGALTDTDLRQLDDRLNYLRELESRRETVISSIKEQGKLTEALHKSILSADNKTTLEDLYLPYKPKRRTKAQIAREAGLEPLAELLLKQPTDDPSELATPFIDADKAVPDAVKALEGARFILMERFAEQADLLGHLRDYVWRFGVIKSVVAKGKETEGQKFADYFEYSEAIAKVPSHRALALFRGRKEGVLQISLVFNQEQHFEHCLEAIANSQAITVREGWLWQTVEWTWKVKLQLKLELELLNQLREAAEAEAIRVFQDNLTNLLMMAPAGNRTTLGLDPGLRTGVKVVVVDGTGKLLEHTTIFPHVPRKQWDQSIAVIAALCQKHKVELVSIGNGTGSRETERLVTDILKQYKDLNFTKIVVSEAGASVYSASELAANEFPDLDVSFRGAVSIARRLQDPLAELVKIDPKAIGVGQYQHDVNQIKLARSLHAVLEDCVNAVGADINTASVPLLASISGLSERIAKNIVTFREKNGRFTSRDQLKKVAHLGDKTYEQAVGFLRIINGDNPLDASAVHPESYSVVSDMLSLIDQPLKKVMGNNDILNSLQPEKFVTDNIGLPTIKDIIAELHKPGRDPRPEFKMAVFKEGVETVSDLKPGMKLEGVITNVANFGAFVDIGVHQDGLVHISEVADRFVSNIHEVVKVGQIVQVTVMEVDEKRKRISLSMKSEPGAQKPAQRSKPKERETSHHSKKRTSKKPESQQSLMAEQLKNLLK